MKIIYDEQNDAVYFKLSDEPYFESEEIEKDVIVDYDRENNIVALEVLNFKSVKKELDLPIKFVAA